jgi:hypothetical protein
MKKKNINRSTAKSSVPDPEPFYIDYKLGAVDPNPDPNLVPR